MNKDEQKSQQYLIHQNQYFDNLRLKIQSKFIHERQKEAQTIVQEQLGNGTLEITEGVDKLKLLSKQISQKSIQLNKELLNLSISMKKQKLSRTKTEAKEKKIKQIPFMEELLKQYKEKNKNYGVKLQKLKSEKEEFHKKKLEQEKVKEMIRIREEQKMLNIKEELLKQSKQYKKERIARKISQIERKRKQRQEILKNSAAKSVQKQCHFISMKRIFEVKEEQYQNRKRKSYKQSIKRKTEENTPNKIEEHKRNYEKRLKNLIKKRTKSEQSEKTKVMLENNFKIIGKDGSIIHKEMEKRYAMKNFDRKVSQKIKLNIDFEKKFQLQHAIQREKNHQFYKISKKSLLQKQSYYNLKQLLSQVNKNQIGNKYMHEGNKLKKLKTEGDQVQTSREKEEKYKNYLDDAKRNGCKKQKDEVEEIVNKNTNNSTAILELNKKLKEYSKATLQKIQKLHNTEQYENFIQAEGQIDQEYLKIVKAKLTCALLS